MKPRPISQAIAALCLGLIVLLSVRAAAAKSSRPNVVLIITDDQGYGDLGLHGNPVLRTPHLDRLGREGVRFENFYVSPVCAPTRASLLTGRYNYRTGVVDTFRGRALMHPDEITLAEWLRRSGYHTGIFGKWHLGDNHPLRPPDQGFDESLVHLGGGIGQPSDPPGGTNYFDPILQRKGRTVKTSGYCSDVYTDAALRYIERHREEPFYVHLAFNAPHTPLIPPADRYQEYRQLDFAPDQFPTTGQPWPGLAKQDDIARLYAMVGNIDDNVGRLLAKLEELRLAENTIVMFMSDNGAQGPRYNAGLRGRKGSVYDGGIRVPFFFRWPARVSSGRTVDRIAAHIDVMPTVLDACRVRRPRWTHLDGLSLMPLIEGRGTRWPERTLYFQWHRGDVPELGRACAARSDFYKLVQPEIVAETNWNARPVFQLFDMVNDPYEMRDIAAEHPDLVKKMRAGYEAWFKDVGRTRGYEPVRIHLGTREENPVTLTRQDWRGPRAEWSTNGLGHWEVDVRKADRYDITLRFPPRAVEVMAQFALRDAQRELRVAAGAGECTFRDVPLRKGPARLRASFLEGERSLGVQFVEVRRKE